MSQTLTVTGPQVRAVWKLLSTISDPEIPVLTLTDLGMVRSVEHDDNGWHIGFTPTWSGCPATAFLQDAIRDTLARHGYTPVRVSVCLHPAWTTAWMSEAAKARLREYGISPPVGHSCSAELPAHVECPRCGSLHTTLISEFSSTACKALWRCESCREPFDYFKCI